MGATGLIFGLAMTHLLPFRFSAILLLGLGLLLPGCCANNVCDCPDEAQAGCQLKRVGDVPEHSAEDRG